MAEETQPAEATTPDPVDLVEMTSEIAAAYMAHNHVTMAEVPALIASVHATLAGLGQAPAAAAEPVKLTPAVPIKKSVADEHIISLEDGKSYRVLKRHLASLGLTPAAYREKWGLPKDYPLVSPAASRARSEIAKGMGLAGRLWKG